MPSKQDKARRWWQFSLRDMLALTLIAGLIIGWWLDHRSQASALRSMREDHETLKRVLKASLDHPSLMRNFSLGPILHYEPPQSPAEEGHWKAFDADTGDDDAFEAMYERLMRYVKPAPDDK